MTPLLTPARSGVYRAPVHIDAVRHSAESEASWTDIDLSGVSSKGALLDSLGQELRFPPTFGRNWDALADMLQDRSMQPANAWVLRLTHDSHAARALGADWATLLEILEQTAAYWKHHGKAFVVFVDDGAELQPWI